MRLHRPLARRLLLTSLVALSASCLAGCPRNQTTLDDRPLEKRPHVETERPQERGDPFRP